MKRADITALFPDATKEQIDQLLNLNGADVNAARGDVQNLNSQIDELRKALDGAADSEQGLRKAKDQITKLQTELDGMKNAEKIRGIREKVSGEKKIPASLLTGETEEDCAKQADAILSFAKSQGYPSVPDGGDPNHPPASSTRDIFANWADANL